MYRDKMQNIGLDISVLHDFLVNNLIGSYLSSNPDSIKYGDCYHAFFSYLVTIVNTPVTISLKVMSFLLHW